MASSIPSWNRRIELNFIFYFMAKIIKINELDKITHEIKKQGKTIVLAGGCFDILHIGHVLFLEKAKQQGDVLFIMVESDEAIRKRKGKNRPIHQQKERAKILGSLTNVDYIILLPNKMSNNDYDMLIKKIQPNTIATTKPDPLVEHKKRQAKITGAKLVYVINQIKNVSTSKMVQALAEEF